MRRILTCVVVALLVTSVTAPAEARPFHGFFHFLRAALNPHDHNRGEYRYEHRAHPGPIETEDVPDTARPNTDTNAAVVDTSGRGTATTEPTAAQIADAMKAAVEKATTAEAPVVIGTSTPVCRKYSPETDGLVETSCD